MRGIARVAVPATALFCALGSVPAHADVAPAAANLTATSVAGIAAKSAAPASSPSFKSLFVSLAPTPARSAASLLVAPVAKPIAMLAPLPPKVQTAAVRSTRTGGSLADQVSDRLASETADEEHECLATSVYFESKGQPYKGQLAVAETILNRTRSGRFPGTVCGVVKQRGQFGFVRGGRFPSVRRAAKQWQEAVAIAQIALKQAVAEVANKALYFNVGGMPSPGLRRVAQFGAQVFYR